MSMGGSLSVLCSCPGAITLSSITANWEETLENVDLITAVLNSREPERSGSNLPSVTFQMRVDLNLSLINELNFSKCIWRGNSEIYRVH